MASWVFARGSCEDKNEIHLQNGKYTNILIAIDSDVAEDDTLIEHIKDTFTTGSEILFNATDRRLSWGEIQILVPITWSRKPDVYETATYQSFGSANIRVVEGAARNPSITNHAGCGVQGLDMTLTSGYLLQNVDECSGKAMVREWGRLRWSLFPEHFTGSGYGEANQYYDSTTQRYEPTRCSRDLTGDMIDGDGSSCPENPNGKVDEECVFIPDSEQTTSTSLLFGSHCVDSIHQFCDPLVHNYEADNLQNYHCRRSAWEVMLSTGDITSEDYFPDPNQVDTEPSFTILQQPVRRVVLVLDISGSMSGSYRIDKLIQSSAIFIRHYIPAGSHLSIVTFHSYATSNADLTLVENYDTSREYLVNALPTGTTGSTCIGCGIVTALNVLGDTTNGSYVILLSDGGENVSPYIRDTMQAINESGVVMDTIAVTNSADEQMEDLSSMTGGKPYFCIDGGSSACLTEAFLATVSERPELNFIPIPIQLRMDDVMVSGNGQEILSFVIGEEEGNDTVIAVTRFVDDDVEVIVEGPNGEYYDKNSQGYVSDSNRRIISLTIPITEAGNWTVTLYNTYNYDQTVGLMITTKQRDETGVVSIDVILGSRSIDHHTTPMLAVYGMVQKNYQPVLGASAEAIIQSSVGTTWPLQLSDSGKGFDKVKDDGVYSGVFLDFDGDGRYGVTARVEGMVIEPQTEGSRRRRRSVGTTIAPSQTAFMRSASGGAFVVENYSPTAPDILAPSTIMDLRHTELYNNSAVILAWTAVGDDFDHGLASSYELRHCFDFTTLRTNFTECTLVDNDQLLEGNLSDIATAGVEESVTVQLPEGSLNVSHHFSLRASDEAGNVGSTSNIVSTSVVFAAQANTTQAPTSGQPTDISTDIWTDDTTPLLETSTMSTINFLTSSASRAGSTTPLSVTPTSSLTSSAAGTDGSMPSVTTNPFSSYSAELSTTDKAYSSPGVPLTTAEEGIKEPTVTEESYPITTDTPTEEPPEDNTALIIAISVVLSVVILGGGISLFLYIRSPPKVHPSGESDAEKDVMDTKEDESHVHEHANPVFEES
ncbi:calcium-activated chloride channel regulator 1-like [Diadema antillarum]|uniref:calcium-activated chloride channel regulator 1-like n=1 Tax=Diadema antillarum TaxID=105358 RepID=UPI003A859293